MDWYAEFYSSNIMNLVLYSDQSLEQLEALAKRSFSAVKNHDRQIQQPMSNPFGDADELGRFFSIVPVKDIDHLMVNWYFES